MARREFPGKVRALAFERANGCCEKCGVQLAAGKVHYDHILPDALGGGPTLANCAVLCRPCHGEKTAKEDVPRIRKADRQRRSHIGAKKSARPLPFGKGSNLKRKVNGQIIDRRTGQPVGQFRKEASMQ